MHTYIACISMHIEPTQTRARAHTHTNTGVYHNEGGSILGRDLLETPTQQILDEIALLVGSHHNAARVLMPLLHQQSKMDETLPSYTLLTGGLTQESAHGAEAPSISAMYGLGLALRESSKRYINVRVNEIRLGMQVNRSDAERMAAPRARPLSLDLGSLCSYIAEAQIDRGHRMRINTNADLDDLLWKYNAFHWKEFDLHPPHMKSDHGSKNVTTKMYVVNSV